MCPLLLGISHGMGLVFDTPAGRGVSLPRVPRPGRLGHTSWLRKPESGFLCTVPAVGSRPHGATCVEVTLGLNRGHQRLHVWQPGYGHKAWCPLSTAQPALCTSPVVTSDT